MKKLIMVLQRCLFFILFFSVDKFSTRNLAPIYKHDTFSDSKSDWRGTLKWSFFDFPRSFPNKLEKPGKIDTFRLIAMVAEPKVRDWCPALEVMPLERTAVVVLNTDIENPPKLVHRLWNESWLRVTVDGGTNKWHSFVKQNALENLKYPDLITGDLDSADPVIVEQFVSAGSQIVHTPNQDETDFTKALLEIKNYCASSHKSIDSVIVMVNMFHRVDHFLSNINTLYKFKSSDYYFDGDIYLMGRNSLTWLLQAGMHRIHVPLSLRLYPQKNFIGLFPIGSACNECTTTGLKWNINGKIMEMGGLISSSNTFNGDPFVTITNSSSLLWTMTLGYEESF